MIEKRSKAGEPGRSLELLNLSGPIGLTGFRIYFMAFLQFGSSQQEKEILNWPEPNLQIDFQFTPSQNVKVLSGITKKIEHQADKYPRTIVVGLGETGEVIVQQWLDQLAHEKTGKQKFLFAYVIKHNGEVRLVSEQVATNHLVLAHDASLYGGINSSKLTAIRSQRAAVQAYFRSNSNLSKFSEWLGNSLFDLGLENNTRVFIVGSINEPIIGILGDLLQIFRLKPGLKNPYRSISALLSLEDFSSKLSIGHDESYAALTELTRMCYGGVQQLDPLPGMSDEMYHSALLDQIFLISSPKDDRSSISSRDPSKDSSSEEAVGEALFSLSHPSADIIWEDLHDAHNPVEAFVYTLGIRTLQIPVAKIREYIADRLIKAALFGDEDTFTGKKFIKFTSSQLLQSISLEKTLIEWFSAGDFVHPLFRWLYTLDYSDQIRFLPLVSKNIRDFRIQFNQLIGYRLMSLLNDPEESKGLNFVTRLLNSIEIRFNLFIDLIKRDRGRIKNQQEITALIELIQSFIGSITALNKQLVDWSEALGVQSQGTKTDKTININIDKLEDNGSGSFSDFDLNWKKSKVIPPNEGKASSTNNLRKILDDRIENARMALFETTKGKYRRGLANHQMQDVEDYYKKAIRPDLITVDMDEGTALKRVRERLFWWIDSKPNESPQLYIAYIPPSHSAKNPIPQTALYTSKELKRLLDAIYEVAYFQTIDCSDDLSGSWFMTQLEKNKVFLQEASKPLLKFRNGTKNSKTYLISKDSEILTEIKNSMFKAGKIITIGEQNRFTALSIWEDILISTIDFTDKSDSYMSRPHHQTRLQLYSQEKNAAIYESYLRKKKISKDFIFPPCITVSFANQKLVTLFSQAFLASLISLQRDEKSFGGQFWTLKAIGRFKPLRLSPGTNSDPKGLLNAFKKFTLELPNQKQNQYEINPETHFAKVNVDDLLDTLHQKAYAHRSQENFPQCEKTLLNQINQWKEIKDKSIQGLFAILFIELEAPQWEEWKL
jgi:hypothetical protein